MKPTAGVGTVEVTADGEGLVSHAGVALLVELADRVGLTGALSDAVSRSALSGGGTVSSVIASERSVVPKPLAARTRMLLRPSASGTSVKLKAPVGEAMVVPSSNPSPSISSTMV